jgi:hypothetical protein
MPSTIPISSSVNPYPAPRSLRGLPLVATRTPARRSDGRRPRAFDKLTPGLALVEALVGGDGGGGELLVQRQHTLYQGDQLVVAGDVGRVGEVDGVDGIVQANSYRGTVLTGRVAVRSNLSIRRTVSGSSSTSPHTEQTWAGI